MKSSENIKISTYVVPKGIKSGLPSHVSSYQVVTGFDVWVSHSSLNEDFAKENVTNNFTVPPTFPILFKYLFDG